MTRVPAGGLVEPEGQEEGPRFGDPLGCRYHWAEPDRVDAYGDSVRRLATRVELAADAFERTARLPDEVFAGEAAESLRARAGRRHEESALVRDHLQGLGRAVNAYADVLRRHRDGLQELQSYAAAHGLEVRDGRVWPPVDTIADDAPAKDVDAWERDWRSYRECFDARTGLHEARRAGTRDLVRALAEHADVHPVRSQQQTVAATARQVRFGELRREAAAEALEAVDAREAADTARRAVAALVRRERAALDDLEELVASGATPEQVAAQTAHVGAVRDELVVARAEAGEAEVAADRERALAARQVEAAEDGRPLPAARPVEVTVEVPPVREPVEVPVQPDEGRAADLRSRLG